MRRIIGEHGSPRHGERGVLCGCLSGLRRPRDPQRVSRYHEAAREMALSRYQAHFVSNVSDQLFLFRDYRVNLSSKVRDSVLDDVPENLRVYLKIFMNKDVSEI